MKETKFLLKYRFLGSPLKSTETESSGMGPDVLILKYPLPLILNMQTGVGTGGAVDRCFSVVGTIVDSFSYSCSSLPRTWCIADMP